MNRRPPRSTLTDTLFPYRRSSVLDRRAAAGCDRILVAPLYPQYCGATTASVVDAVAAHLASLRRQPALRFLPPYAGDPAYIAALKVSVEAGRSEEHTSELQSLMRISYAVFRLKKKNSTLPHNKQAT